MITKQEIRSLIFKALKNINDERQQEDKFFIDLETPLFGQGATLDSLSLVSMIVDIESDLAELVGFDISLTDDRAMSQESSPFANVKSLTDYINLLLSEI